MKYVVCTLIIFGSLEVFADQLSDVALFNRCYSHLTKKRVNSSHALLARVKDGSIDPIDACMSVFNKAQLNQSNKVTVDDNEGRSVIKNMTDLHNSFFNEKSVRASSSCTRRSLLDFTDELAPALYFTRALLKDGAKVSDVLQGTKGITSIRENVSPANRGPASNAAAQTYLSNGKAASWDTSSAFIGTGDMVGVKDAPALILPQNNRDVLDSLGGGVIGSKVYLFRVLQNQVQNRSDGAVKMNRRWAQSVASDFLCRDLPLVRESDGAPYIKTASNASFRTQSACIGCHATMDRMAGAVRGLEIVTTGTGNCNTNSNGRTQHISARTPDRDPAEAWPDDADSDYYRRPAEGYLYFRSYNGDLIHKKFSDIEELGQQLAQTNDFYVCTAKKYYQFLTGIEVSLADINDPFSNVKLNAESLKHRNKVIEYGLNLKNHQSLSVMLEEMMSSSTYKLSDYGIQGGN